jgi:hypothetical protein
MNARKGLSFRAKRGICFSDLGDDARCRAMPAILPDPRFIRVIRCKILVVLRDSPITAMPAIPAVP